MNNPQQPGEKPPAPWFTRSAWSLAPILFFLELLGILGALVFMNAIGAIEPFFFLVVMGFTAYYGGRRSVIDQEAPAPRKRLLGTAVLVSAIFGVFFYLGIRSAQAEFIETLKASPDFMAKLKEADPQGEISLEELAPGMFLVGSFFFSLLLFVIHSLCLVLGARSAEAKLGQEKKP